MLLKISKRINREVDLRMLGEVGLGVEEYITDSQLRNQGQDIQSAAYSVLRYWRNSQENSHIAYTRMRDALQHADLMNIKTEVLDIDD